MPAYVRDGSDASTARVKATMVVAGFRGFLLDVCATGDDERVERAVALWIETLESAFTALALARAARELDDDAIREV